MSRRLFLIRLKFEPDCAPACSFVLGEWERERVPERAGGWGLGEFFAPSVKLRRKGCTLFQKWTVFAKPLHISCSFPEGPI
jgi:hypothetical protein